jgi:hypothetical protein
MKCNPASFFRHRRSQVLLGLLGVVAGCTDKPVHVFDAYAFTPGATPKTDCLQSPAEVDVLSGPDPGSCPVLRCWTTPQGAVYITDESCDSPPDFTDDTDAPAGSPCAEALLVYAEPGHGLCPAEPTSVPCG